MASTEPTTSRQVAAFAVVGGASTLTHYVVALAAAQFMPITYANPIGFLAAFFVSYVGHLNFTFDLRGDERQHRRRMPRFFLIALVGLLIGQAVVVAVSWLTDWPNWLALGFVAASVPIITFVLSKLWVFRRT